MALLDPHGSGPLGPLTVVHDHYDVVAFRAFVASAATLMREQLARFGSRSGTETA